MHVFFFCAFCADSHAQSVIINKISAWELSQKLTKSALLVGYYYYKNENRRISACFAPFGKNVSQTATTVLSCNQLIRITSHCGFPYIHEIKGKKLTVWEGAWIFAFFFSLDMPYTRRDF